MTGWETILDSLSGRRVLVVGLARSGNAAARLLVQCGARVTGCDRQVRVEGTAELEQAGVDIRPGEDGPQLLTGQELVVLSPGVAFDSALCQEARRAKVPLVGELELGWKMLRRRRRFPLVAVTGTNGKSTTCALCNHLLRTMGFNSALSGNIGNPLCLLLLEEKLPQLAVIEVSSFQLEHLSRPAALDPEVAAWLNLTPDHLDRHGSMDNYAQMKRRLLLGQTGQDTAILFADDAAVRAAAAGLPGRVRWFGRASERLGADDMLIEGNMLHAPGGGHLELRNSRLAGEHNAENASVALLAARALGMASEELQAGLDSFPGLPHRIEPVAEIGGVRYVDDSKGTNLDATMKSLTSFDCPIVLIAGGRGKGTGYEPLRPVVSQRVKHLVLMGEEAGRMEKDLAGCAPISRAGSMEDAVQQAAARAAAGDVVLLSPACASFDMFTDYHHRGRMFAAAVQNLREKR